MSSELRLSPAAPTNFPEGLKRDGRGILGGGNPNKTRLFLQTGERTSVVFNALKGDEVISFFLHLENKTGNVIQQILGFVIRIRTS